MTFLHPIGLDGSWWTEHASDIANQYRALLVDLAGHGHTEYLAHPELSALADDVRAVWDETSTESSVVVGVSMGGMVAQELAVGGAGVSGLVLVCTAAKFHGSARAAIRARAEDVEKFGMAAVADTTVERWFDAKLVDRRAPIVEAARRQLAAGRPDVHRDCWQMISEIDFVARLGNVKVPSLVLAGEADASIPRGTTEELAEAIPHSDLQVVPGGSHMFALERHDWLRPALVHVS